ncbi:MAG: DMT family transporter [Alphaproteobacteria bacterium]|nr:DMT family transporter [Alphaproteobacteria bacterium]
MRRLWHSAWTLLALANLFWSGNIVLGRGVAGVVPPIALAYWRWTGAFLVAFAFAWPHLKRDAPVLRRHWRMMLLLSATGIATYNTMSYIGLNSTTALNALLLQSACPLIIIVWTFALFGERPTLAQAAGILASFLGVLVIAGRGSLATLLQLQINRGDIWILVALMIYGAYAALFRRRPAVHPLSFLVTAMGIGSCLILPFYLWEVASGARVQGSWEAYLSFAYIAVFPSFIAYLFLNRGFELIGAGRAGQSMHLMPVFGSILAVLFLGESFRAYHAIGVALIAAGIALASRKAAPQPAAATEPSR